MAKPPKLANSARAVRLMQLRSGHVMLLLAEFQPINCLLSLTYGAMRPHVGLSPNF